MFLKKNKSIANEELPMKIINNLTLIGLLTLSANLHTTESHNQNNSEEAIILKYKAKEKDHLSIGKVATASLGTKSAMSLVGMITMWCLSLSQHQNLTATENETASKIHKIAALSLLANFILNASGAIASHSLWKSRASFIDIEQLEKIFAHLKSMRDTLKNQGMLQTDTINEFDMLIKKFEDEHSLIKSQKDTKKYLWTIKNIASAYNTAMHCFSLCYCLGMIHSNEKPKWGQATIQLLLTSLFETIFQWEPSNINHQKIEGSITCLKKMRDEILKNQELSSHDKAVKFNTEFKEFEYQINNSIQE